MLSIIAKLQDVASERLRLREQQCVTIDFGTSRKITLATPFFFDCMFAALS